MVCVGVCASAHMVELTGGSKYGDEKLWFLLIIREQQAKYYTHRSSFVRRQGKIAHAPNNE